MFQVIKHYTKCSVNHVVLGDDQDFDSGQWGTKNADGALIEIGAAYGTFPLYQVFLDADRQDVAAANMIPYVRGQDYEAETTEFDSTADYAIGTELVVYDGILTALPEDAGTYCIVGIYTGSGTDEDGNTTLQFDRKDYVKVVT